MALKTERVDVWVGSIEDRPGGLSEKLAVIAEAGAQLEFMIARRAPDKPGTGVVFLTPLKGAAQSKAAKAVGIRKSKSMRVLRVEGTDKPGMGAKMTQALTEAGVNLRGFSAQSLGKRFVAHVALDDSAAATKATRVLKKL